MLTPSEDGGLIRRCALDLGITMSEVAYIVRNGPKKYKVYTIGKRDGGRRVICQPSRDLKVIQYHILKTILSDCPVHPSAMAYERGASIRSNAEAHSGARVLIKADFEAFFPSIRVADWISYVKKRFPKWSGVDVDFTVLAMFWGMGGDKPVCLSIGAPTSPKLSNIIMYKFDEEMAVYAEDRGLKYTRYADDITISSEGYIDFAEVMGFVRGLLSRYEGPRLFINDKKTGLFSRKSALRVTGIVLPNSGGISLGRDRKRAISSMIHKWSIGEFSQDQERKLVGLLAFANDAEPEFLNRLRRKYGKDALDRLMGGS